MALEIYQHEVHKFTTQGLQLRLPVDLVPQGQYSRYSNVLSDIEGAIETRAGCTALATVTTPAPIHTLFRLNQQPTSDIESERLIGADVYLYSQRLPSGDVNPTTTTYDGGPLSIIDFRFDFDPASWAIIANSAAMRKIRMKAGAGSILTPFYEFLLGVIPPSLAATATAGGAGLLNNGSGPGYDWRYTYVNSITNSESNPSPIDIVGGIGNQSPTLYQTPTNLLPTTNLTVSPKAQPWKFTGGINLAYNYGINDGTSPVVYSPSLIPGQAVQISYVSGTVQCSDARPKVNAAGQASYVTDGLGGFTGTGFPTKYMPGSTLGLGGLCGAFTDSTGQVIQPLSIGLGGTFVVPAGATKLQLGIDDDRYVDNTSTGFTVQIKGVPTSAVSNPGRAFDGDPTTYMEAVSTAYPPTSESVRYFGWPAAGTVTGLSLSIDYTTFGSGTLSSTSTISIIFQYSLDGGATWLTMFSSGATPSIPRNTISTTFAVGVDMTQLQVRAAITGNGKSGDTWQQVLRVYEIFTTTTAGSATTLDLTNQLAIVCVGAPSGDGQVDMIRLYRRGGSLVDSWYKVDDFLISTLAQGTCGTGYYEIIDNIPDNELGDSVALDNDMPVTGITNLNTPLTYIWEFDNRVLGVGDPSRSNEVYFSKQGNADEWPPQNHVPCGGPSDPLQAGCRYNTRCFAFSHERMYELVPGLVAGVTFSPFPTPVARGLISPWGLCTYDKIYFVSKDGVYATTGGPEQSIVENDLKPLFPTKDGPGRSAHGYEAVDMSQPNQIRLAFHNDEIYFTYAGTDTGTLQTLAFDVRKSRWRAATYTPPMHTIYSEPATTSSLLLAGTDGTMYQAAQGTDNGTGIAVSLRTGAHDQGLPLSQKEYGNVVFDLDPGGADAANPVVITPYINGEAQAESALTVIGEGRVQVPLSLSDIFAYNLEFEVAWTRVDAGIDGTPVAPVLYQYDILWRAEPTQLTHWEARENSYGLAGYGHLRDGYLGLRSNSTLTMRLYGDGTLLSTITFASTGGARRKLPFAMPANKWKLLKVTLDDLTATPQPFRVYEADCEFRIKQWLTPLGYRNLPILGGESQMVQSAYSSMILGEGRSQ